MEKQKTAVEWLHEELNQRIDYIPIKYWDTISEIFKEALMREKIHLKDAYNIAKIDFYDSFDEYYSETYKPSTNDNI